MKKIIKDSLRFLLLMVFLLLNFCNKDKQVTGRYYLKNNKFGKSLCYRHNDDGDCLEIIQGGFGAIGFDNNYIIVHRTDYDYLIVPIYKKLTYSPEKGILGPLSLTEFNKQKEKLKIKADFTEINW